LEPGQSRISDRNSIIAGIILCVAGVPFLLEYSWLEQSCINGTACPNHGSFLDVGIILLVVGILVLIPGFPPSEPRENGKTRTFWTRPLLHALIATALFIFGVGILLFWVFYLGFENTYQSYNWIFSFVLGLMALSLFFGFVALFSSMQPKSYTNNLESFL